MLNRPSRAQNEETVTVGRGEREQRRALEEGSQHCIFLKWFHPNGHMLREVTRKEALTASGANQRDFSIPGNQETPVKGSWRNTQKRFTRKRMCNWMTPSQPFLPPYLTSSPPHPALRSTGSQVSLRRGQRVKELRQAQTGEDSKFQASKNLILGCSEHFIAWKTKPLDT